jgi:hypothetical protein
MSCDSAGLPSTNASMASCDSASNETKPDSKDLEKWAELLAAYAAQATQSAQPVPLPVVTPEAWRGDVDALTPEASRSEASQAVQELLGQAVRTGSGPDGENELNRIQVRLNAGDLGELSLVVERSLDGLRVQIGAENNEVLSAIAKQSVAMAQSLASAGQSVTSLSFVSMDGLGINLARAKEGSGNRARDEASTNTDDESIDQRRRKSRPLDVLG